VETSKRKGFSGLQVTLIVLVTVAVTVFVGWWVIRTYIFPSQLEPVELSRAEQVELGRKLKAIGVVTGPLVTAGDDAVATGAVPEPYSEAGADRMVFLSERELNGMIARDPELASNFALDLADDLVSFTLLLPVPPDFPVMPGRIVRVRGGAEVAFAGGVRSISHRSLPRTCGGMPKSGGPTRDAVSIPPPVRAGRSDGAERRCKYHRMRAAVLQFLCNGFS